VFTARYGLGFQIERSALRPLRVNNTVEVKLYIDECNAQVLNLFIYLLLLYMFRVFY
jgi:hypothetical protein